MKLVMSFASSESEILPKRKYSYSSPRSNDRGFPRRRIKSRTGKGISKVLDKMEKKYPKETPAITYIPKADTLII